MPPGRRDRNPDPVVESAMGSALRLGQEALGVVRDPISAISNPNSSAYRSVEFRRIREEARSLKPESLRALANVLVYGHPENSEYFVTVSVLALGWDVGDSATKAIEPLYDLATTLIALDGAQQTDHVRAYRKRSMDSVLDSWPTIAKRIAYFIHLASSSDEYAGAILPCTLMLTAVCMGADTDPPLK